MRKNTFLKMEDRLIKSVYNNKATIYFVVKSRYYDEETGEMTEQESVYQSKVFIDNPEKFSYMLIDGKNVMENDIKCHVSRLGIEKAVKECGEDLFQLRKEKQGSGYIDVSCDMIEFAGIKYRIRQSLPKSVYSNVASIYTLHLRGIE
jgi:hypothetical protein